MTHNAIIKKSDIEIFTDGSGHMNGFGGWAAFIATPDRILKNFRMGAATSTSVDRMEFTAMLEGMQGAFEMSFDLPERHQYDDWRPTVLWHSDRENLVLSVQNVYGRSNCQDLWSRFAYYEKVMIIQAKFTTEKMIEQMPEFREVDLQSSAGYQQIKSYMTQFPFSPSFKFRP